VIIKPRPKKTLCPKAIMIYLLENIGALKKAIESINMPAKNPERFI
jgi:hypothetical protein